jgi:hypothetical protein
MTSLDSKYKMMLEKPSALEPSTEEWVKHGSCASVHCVLLMCVQREKQRAHSMRRSSTSILCDKPRLRMRAKHVTPMFVWQSKPDVPRHGVCRSFRSRKSRRLRSRRVSCSTWIPSCWSVPQHHR